MTCQDIGTLQAYLDGEVSRDEKKSIMKHLENCGTCRASIKELQNLQSFCDSTLEVDDAAIDVERAWTKFEAKLQPASALHETQIHTVPTRKGWSSLKTNTKRLAIAGVAAAAIFSSFAIPQVQVAGNQFLSLFRVDQFEMVQLTPEDLQEVESWMSEHEAGEIDLKELGKMERSIAEGELQQFQTAASAGEAGYPVPSLENFVVSGVDVIPAQTLTFTLDVEKANQMLVQLEAGGQFEAALDGKPFSVSIFETVKANYAVNGSHVSYVQTQSPEITVPDGTSIAQLRDTLLSLPFLPENVKSQLANIADFETTLPVPAFDTEEAKVTEVQVNGAEGFTFVGQEESSIVWKEGGRLHMIMAEMTLSSEQLMELAAQAE